MIVAHALDLPKIEPDNWDTFWDIWNNNSQSLIKVGYGDNHRYQSATQLGSRDHWIGMDVFRTPLQWHWVAPFVDISKTLPNMYNTLTSLELPNIRLVRIVQSIKDHSAHSDTGSDSWEVRAMLKCDNPSKHWYYTPYGNKGTRESLRLPNDTNWFTYNDTKCHHGTIYFPDSPKYLIQVYYGGKISIDLLSRSIDKYPESVISFIQ